MKRIIVLTSVCCFAFLVGCVGADPVSSVAASSGAAGGSSTSASSSSDGSATSTTSSSSTGGDVCTLDSSHLDNCKLQ